MYRQRRIQNKAGQVHSELIRRSNQKTGFNADVSTDSFVASPMLAVPGRLFPLLPTTGYFVSSLRQKARMWKTILPFSRVEFLQLMQKTFPRRCFLLRDYQELPVIGGKGGKCGICGVLPQCRQSVCQQNGPGRWTRPGHTEAASPPVARPGAGRRSADAEQRRQPENSWKNTLKIVEYSGK